MKTVTVDMLGSIFTQAFIDVISKVSGFSFDVLSTEHDAGFDGSVALMSLNNCVKSGMLLLSAGEPGVRTLCSYIEGVPEDEITKADIEDVLCELVNMTAGSVKLQLGDTEYMFTLSSPLIINGKDISISTKKRVNVISRTLGNGEISVKLKVIY